MQGHDRQGNGFPSVTVAIPRLSSVGVGLVDFFAHSRRKGCQICFIGQCGIFLPIAFHCGEAIVFSLVPHKAYELAVAFLGPNRVAEIHPVCPVPMGPILVEFRSTDRDLDDLKWLVGWDGTRRGHGVGKRQLVSKRASTSGVRL